MNAQPSGARDERFARDEAVDVARMEVTICVESSEYLESAFSRDGIPPGRCLRMKVLTMRPDDVALDAKRKAKATRTVLAARGPLRREIACARALLDELEAVLAEEAEEDVLRDVLAQTLDELARVASMMRQPFSYRHRGDGGGVIS
jgi:hypothetical protein